MIDNKEYIVKKSFLLFLKKIYFAFERKNPCLCCIVYQNYIDGNLK
jgi:hypothetical protein